MFGHPHPWSSIIENYGCLVKSAPSRSHHGVGTHLNWASHCEGHSFWQILSCFQHTKLQYCALFVVVICNSVGDMNSAAVDIENLPFLQSGFMYLKGCGVSILRYPKLGSSLLSSILSVLTHFGIWNLDISFFCIKILRVCRYSSVGRLSQLPKSASTHRLCKKQALRTFVTRMT